MNALLTPFSPDPAGSDPRDDPQFAVVRAELQKLTSLTPVEVDFGLVRASSEAVLVTVAKHIGVALDRAFAHLALRDPAGFASALDDAASLVETFDVHPRRGRARANTVEVFLERSCPRLSALPPSAAWVAALDAAVSHLDRAIATWGPDAPSLRPLRSEVEKLQNRLPSPEPVISQPAPPAAVDAAPASLPAPRSPGPQAPRAVDSPDVRPWPVRVRELGETIAHSVTQGAPSVKLAPGTLRVFLTGLYLGLLEPPPTVLALPSPKGFLDELRESAAPERVGCFLRGFPKARFALDALRHLHAALVDLGETTLASELALEARILVERFPSLLDATFRDGVPTVDAATRAWLKPPPVQAVRLPAVPAEEPAGEAGIRGREVLRGLLALAEAARTPEARDEFTAVAARLVDQHGLEVYDPETASDVFAACAQRDSDGPRWLARLAVLDPRRAASLLPTSKR